MEKPFLRLVAEDIQQRFGKDISDIAIVFNNKRPITYLKKHLVDVFGQAIWSPQFFTIQEFLSRSTEDVQASALTQFFYLFELHNALLIKEGREPELLEEFYPIAEKILSDFGQLDYDLVPVDQIYMELHDTTAIDLAFQHFTPEQQEFIRQFWQSFSMKGHTAVQQRFLSLWKKLPVLYKELKEKLKSEKQTNHPTIYRELAEGKAQHQQFHKDFKQILFVGFNALNRAEAKLFKQWQDEGLALFYFDADAHYLDDKMQEAGLFIRRNLEQTGLINALGDVPNIIGNRNTEVHLYQSLGKNSEAKLLHDVLEKQLTEEQYGQESAAVLLADESLLVPLLQSLPQMDINITTGYPLIQSPIFGLFDLWMETQQLISHQKKEKIPYQLLETFISHPLSKVSPQQKQSIQRESAEKQLFEIQVAEIDVSSSALPKFFKPLNHPSELIPTMVHLIDELLMTIASNGRIRQIESNLLIETKKVLNQLHLGFAHLGPLSISFQIGLIRKAIASINSAIEGDQLKGLQIMGLLESRCLNFDHVYILGANEGILPKTSSGATFLPNNLRKAYGLPVLENQDALSAYLFYRHFQFSHDIHVFYNGIVDESSTGEESRFIKQMEFETPLQFIKHTQQQPLLFPTQPEELIIPKKDEIWEQLYQTYIVRRKALSASAFTTYLQSPLQFFLKYVADIKEPPSISQEFEMNKLGTVIHECMEKLLTPLLDVKDFTPTQELKAALERVDQQVLQEIGIIYLTDFKTLDELNSLQRIMHKIATEYIKMYLQYDMDQYESIRIVELENDEDYFLDFPIEIQGKQETIKLYGIIDRVDEVIDRNGVRKLRIVDYKTGSDQVLFTNLDKVFAANTDNKALLQTLFYAYVYEQKSGLKGLEPHLYVARRMREDGTLFRNKSGSMTFDDFFLEDQKQVFVGFLREQLEELFNPEVPFKHNPDAVVYPSDPYTLFYRYSTEEKASEEA
ncbi:PD-(D/E)XK nuclease family protein [Sphingobacterium lactis]|uniref:PD-(D/E)XK nuclease superfamily protein n=1 Tax=Sphingobacterium lactis TaxID=797291 RepID=A0A1H5V5Z9_9SPHI|nr:PD-(D/E)XK nuclease family protein [Sphingobacterium lactis]SEF82749.1 PD-(D/E)XK nuclease superfamily protein [Sphingobacterium lactis]